MWSRQVWADYSMSLGILQARQPRWREIGVVVTRVAEVDCLLAKAKMVIKFFVKCVFYHFRDKCVVLSVTHYKCNIYQETLFLAPPKKTFLVQRFPKSE